MVTYANNSLGRNMQTKPRRRASRYVAYTEDGSVIKYSIIPTTSKLESDSYLAEHKNQRVILRLWRAFTTDHRSGSTIGLLNREVDEWKQLHHRHIAEFMGLANTASYIPGLISRYYANGDIMNYIKRNPDADVLHLMRGVASALSYMHARTNPAVHGNVRGSNILISDEGEAILADYGMSRVPDFAVHFARPSANIFDDGRWQSPEILIGASATKDKWGATPATDTYSFGMTLLEVCTGEKPFMNRRFYATDLFEVFRGERPERPDQTAYPLVTDDMWDIMESCWQQRAQDRPSMAVVERWLRLARTARDIENV